MCAWATCYSASNNIDYNSPPIMKDGRNFSSFQPEAVINDRIQKDEGIKTNWGYRQYLQENGTSIMSYNSNNSCIQTGLDCHINSDRTPSTNVPHKFRNVFDTSKPGFGYSHSDLKSPYLSREQLNARLVSPSINLSNLKTLNNPYDSDNSSVSNE